MGGNANQKIADHIVARQINVGWMVDTVILTIINGQHSVPSPVIDLHGSIITALKAICFPPEGQVCPGYTGHIHHPVSYASMISQPQMIRARMGGAAGCYERFSTAGPAIAPAASAGPAGAFKVVPCERAWKGRSRSSIGPRCFVLCGGTITGFNFERILSSGIKTIGYIG